VTSVEIPKKGDFIVVTFDPRSGHEQKGRRPALVVSNDLFNRHTGMAVVCPVTKTDRRFPFHVAIQPGGPVSGFVMAEQVKSTDFRSRRAARIGRASPALVDEVLAILDACLF
jgi:mRNA interferase MazF